MGAIVPPTPRQRQVTRRVKAYRSFIGCIACGLLAAIAFIAGAPLLGSAAVVLTIIAAIGAVIYRFTEAPQRVTVRDHVQEPPLIHLKDKD